MGLAAGVSCWQGPMRSLWSSWSSWVHALVYSVLGKNTRPWASSRSPLLAKYPVPFGSKIVRQAPRFCHRTLTSVFQPGAARRHLCKMFDHLPHSGQECWKESRISRRKPGRTLRCCLPKTFLWTIPNSERLNHIPHKSTTKHSWVSWSGCAGGKGTREYMPASCVHSAKETQHTMLRRQYFYSREFCLLQNLRPTGK